MDNNKKVAIGITVLLAIVGGIVYWTYVMSPVTSVSVKTEENFAPAIPAISLPSGGGFETITIPPIPDGKG